MKGGTGTLFGFPGFLSALTSGFPSGEEVILPVLALLLVLVGELRGCELRGLLTESRSVVSNSGVGEKVSDGSDGITSGVRYGVDSDDLRRQ